MGSRLVYRRLSVGLCWVKSCLRECLESVEGGFTAGLRVYVGLGLGLESVHWLGLVRVGSSAFGLTGWFWAASVERLAWVLRGFGVTLELARWLRLFYCRLRLCLGGLVSRWLTFGGLLGACLGLVWSG